MQCRVYRRCGGCSMLEQSYANQIRWKQAVLERLFPKETVLPMLKDKNPDHYRHKIYATFGKNAQGIFLGLYGYHNHRLVNSMDCLIQHKKGNEILRTLCELANDFHLSVYQEDRRKGLLRHVYLRISSKDEKVMMVLVLGEKKFPGSKKLVKILLEKHPEIETVILNYNFRKTSIVLGEQERVVYGKGYLMDKIDGLSFRISSHSFYQVNPKQAYRLYQRAIELANLKKEMKVVDACSGTGTISLLLARHVQSVIGIELNPQAVFDANENKKVNQIQNVQFLQGRVEEVIPRHRIQADVLFLDPPRSGMGPCFMTYLDQLKIPKIVYISCDPNTQARDIQILKSHYSITVSQGVDMFPQTKNIENILVLERKRNEESRKSLISRIK